jgi:Fe-S cluster biogenesis protein NfuA
MALLGDVGQVEALSVRLEIVLISALGGCTVCAECTTGLEIIFGTPDGTPR